jgi:TatA/E family protein of Tat protein translocase
MLKLPGLIIILVLALVLFGTKHLPELGRATWEMIRLFRKTLSGKEEKHEQKDQE